MATASEITVTIYEDCFAALQRKFAAKRRLLADELTALVGEEQAAELIAACEMYDAAFVAERLAPVIPDEWGYHIPREICYGVDRPDKPLPPFSQEEKVWTPLTLTLTCSAPNCSRKAVLYTTRDDVAIKKRLAWCEPCLATKVAKYPLTVTRLNGGKGE